MDQTVARLRRETSEAPAKRAEIEGAVAAAEASLKAAEGDLRAAQSEVKRLEGELAAKQELAAKYRADQLKVKTNDGYRALVNQIAQAEKEAGELEDAILEAMERVDAAGAALAKTRAATDKSRAEGQSRLAEWEEAGTRRAAAMEEAVRERAARAAGGPPEVLARYEKIFRKWGDLAVAKVSHGACGGCHMKLTTAEALEARKEGALATCGFCGRLLHAEGRAAAEEA
jgi:hypothetical protein